MSWQKPSRRDAEAAALPHRYGHKLADLKFAGSGAVKLGLTGAVGGRILR